MFFKIGVLKNFAIFRGTPVLESHFNKVAGMQLSFEILKNSFFHKTPPVAVFKRYINFPGK